VKRLLRSNWLPVALLWGVGLLNYVDRQIIFSQFTLLRHDLHATDAQLGLISSVFLWIYGAVSPFAGYIGDRWGRKGVILISLVVWSAATFLTANAQSVNALLATRALMGFSEAFYLPAALALITARHGAHTRSLATGIHQSGLYTGIVIGGAWGGWMGEHYGWRPAFTILGVLGIAYGLVVAMFLRDDGERSARASVFPAMANVARAPGFVGLAVAFAAVSIANWLIYTWLPLFLNERLNLSLAQAGFTATFYIQASSYIGMLAVGAFTDFMAVRYPGARVYVAAGGMALSAPFLVALSLTSQIGFMIGVLTAIGLLRPFFDINAMPILRQFAPGELCATGYGLLNMIGTIAGGVAAASAGAFKTSLGLPAAYQIAAFTLVTGALALYYGTRSKAALS
jgi:predicted MFS family arabinose efflux permease